MSEQNTTQAVAIEFPDMPDTHTARKSGVPSIREICLTGIAQGRNTPSIAAVIKELHPDTAAAEKSAKHIAWYRAWAKKNVNPYAAKTQA